MALLIFCITSLGTAASPSSYRLPSDHLTQPPLPAPPQSLHARQWRRPSHPATPALSAAEQLLLIELGQGRLEAEGRGSLARGRSGSGTASSSSGGHAQAPGKCDDSCQYAKDASCDDGSQNSDSELCELGTDCTDCRRGSAGKSAGGGGGGEGGGSGAGGRGGGGTHHDAPSLASTGARNTSVPPQRFPGALSGGATGPQGGGGVSGGFRGRDASLSPMLSPTGSSGSGSSRSRSRSSSSSSSSSSVDGSGSGSAGGVRPAGPSSAAETARPSIPAIEASSNSTADDADLEVSQAKEAKTKLAQANLEARAVEATTAAAQGAAEIVSTPTTVVLPIPTTVFGFPVLPPLEV